ncbi:DNA repair protein RAD16 [Ceratocystis fimbriata CBS 114723]|uniref:DNA repair protein RAD16 n=1 Tax=Ceratocystis fimbriata CBS 114723 TaxID=1035309 RepID=A0A2C5WXP7_9PEZI|nr:DNA repair protein RAD16 [Ceratocystis fimbriata CBS 114723]
MRRATRSQTQAPNFPLPTFTTNDFAPSTGAQVAGDQPQASGAADSQTLSQSRRYNTRSASQSATPASATPRQTPPPVAQTGVELKSPTFAISPALPLPPHSFASDCGIVASTVPLRTPSDLQSLESGQLAPVNSNNTNIEVCIRAASQIVARRAEAKNMDNSDDEDPFDVDNWGSEEPTRLESGVVVLGNEPAASRPHKRPNPSEQQSSDDPRKRSRFGLNSDFRTAAEVLAEESGVASLAPNRSISILCNADADSSFSLPASTMSAFTFNTHVPLTPEAKVEAELESNPPWEEPLEEPLDDSESENSYASDDDLPNTSNRYFARSASNHESAMHKKHPFLKTMWKDLEAMPPIEKVQAPQPPLISRQLKPFQREGLYWMTEMEKRQWKGGLLGDEMGLGKTIQAVSLIMSDFPTNKPSLVLIPPVALMQWMNEINSYTNGRLKTFVYHNSRAASRKVTVEELLQYHVILISYNSLESLHRRQTKGLARGKRGEPKVLIQTDSPIHQIEFHRTRSTSTAKACFALKATYRWCLSGTPLQNRIGEFFSLLRFINIRPFASYICRACTCESLEWSAEGGMCKHCSCPSIGHYSIFNREILNPIQKQGNYGGGREAFNKLRILTDRIMLRRQKKDHMDVMELPVKELRVSREFFGDVEKDFANSIMNNSQRQFDTYVARRVLLNNYANIFGLIMQMRQVADHPDLILRKDLFGAEGVVECSICESPAEDAIRSRCKHDFCRVCAREFVAGSGQPDCPRCHIPLVIDLKQPELEQDVSNMKNTSIINRIRTENWTSSTKIELLLHELYMLRSDKETLKVIIFSQFTSMLQLIEWRLRHAGFSTVMLDGTMTPAQRAATIDYFVTNVDVECFLVSLRAGGVALNLTEASRVFLIEPWWNPAVEWQSADRCHRIGQSRPCTITNLVIEDSVESRMVMLQEKKAHMIRSTINNDSKAMESLSTQDLMFLFRGT